MDLTLVGERLQREREQAGLDRHQLAEQARLSPSTVTRIESGTHATVTLAELDHPAVALGIPVRRLTSGSPAPDETEKMNPEPLQPRRADLSRLIERGQTKDARRLTVNPDPLKAVAERPGGPAPDRGHVLAVKLKKAGPDGYNFSRVSVHRTDCPRIPVADEWIAKPASREEINEILSKVDETTEIDVSVSISCRTCGGWSALP